MTEQEKMAECQRICGEKGQAGLHSTAPELCPIQRDIWLGVRKPKGNHP